MQIVGHACERCAEKIPSELDGVGCPRCRRFFHDACLADGATGRGEAAGRAKKKRRREAICPGCGVDLRKELAQHNQATAAQREDFEEQRRVQIARADPTGGSWRVRRAAISIGVLLLALIVRFFLHR